MNRLLICCYSILLTTITYGQTIKADKNGDVVRKISVESAFLNLPVKNGAPTEILNVYHKGKLVREILIELSDEPQFWTNLNLNEWAGSEIELKMENKESNRKGMAQIYQANLQNGKENFYTEKDRPTFHYTAQRGWFNDPNGLVYSNNTWHLFYQHNPYGWGWNNMTWGHAVSKDLVHWQEQGDKLHPDQMGTIFSGSAVVDHNNTMGMQTGAEPTMIAFFTYAGQSSSKWSNNSKFTQGLAYSNDGFKTLTKYSANPIVPNLVADDRDPKVVWHEQSKQWVMALYLGDKDYEFALLASPDLKTWKELQRFKIEGERECPDFFEMEVEGRLGLKKWVFTGANSCYVVGSFDGQKFSPETKVQRHDIGPNFYAAQSYSNTPNQRRVIIGWMRGSDFHGMPFNQQMAFPREMKLFESEAGYSIKSLPVDEIKNIYTAGLHKWQEIEIGSGENPTKTVRAKTCLFDAQIDVAKSNCEKFSFDFDGFEISYEPAKNLLQIIAGDHSKKIETVVEPVNGKLIIKALVDVGSVEVFANEGAVAAAFFYIPNERQQKISTSVRGEKLHIDSITIRELCAGMPTKE